jgi:hypothetical protein
MRGETATPADPPMEVACWNSGDERHGIPIVEWMMRPMMATMTTNEREQRIIKPTFARGEDGKRGIS